MYFAVAAEQISLPK